MAKKNPAPAAVAEAPAEVIVTQALVQGLFSYDVNTGAFTHRQTGAMAVSRHNAGYKTVRIGRKNWLAHRIAWLYFYGEFPPQQIDHINGVRDDNRIANLRACTNAQNCQNVRAHRDGCGFLGASLEKRSGRWQAGIGINGKRVNLGYFETAQQAHAAYLKAKQKHHTFGGHHV